MRPRGSTVTASVLPLERYDGVALAVTALPRAYPDACGASMTATTARGSCSDASAHVETRRRGLRAPRRAKPSASGASDACARRHGRCDFIRPVRRVRFAVAGMRSRDTESASRLAGYLGASEAAREAPTTRSTARHALDGTRATRPAAAAATAERAAPRLHRAYRAAPRR